MKNKVIIDILERLIQEMHKHNLSYQYHTDDDYLVYVESVIEGLKEDDTWFAIPNSSINPDDWVIYTNTGEDLTDNEALKRDVEKELGGQ